MYNFFDIFDIVFTFYVLYDTRYNRQYMKLGPFSLSLSLSNKNQNVCFN